MWLLPNGSDPEEGVWDFLSESAYLFGLWCLEKRNKFVSSKYIIPYVPQRF